MYLVSDLRRRRAAVVADHRVAGSRWVEEQGRAHDLGDGYSNFQVVKKN